MFVTENFWSRSGSLFVTENFWSRSDSLRNLRGVIWTILAYLRTLGTLARMCFYLPYLIVHQPIIIILFCCLNNKQIIQDLTSHTYRESLYFFASSAGIFLPINGPKKSCLGITHLANTPRPALGMLDSLTSSPGGTITSACATVESDQRIKILVKNHC